MAMTLGQIIQQLERAQRALDAIYNEDMSLTPAERQSRLNAVQTRVRALGTEVSNWAAPGP